MFVDCLYRNSFHVLPLPRRPIYNRRLIARDMLQATVSPHLLPSCTPPFDICRVTRYTARADTAGSKTNSARLLFKDGVENNNNALVNFTIVFSCGNPYGNGTQLACAASTGFNPSANNSAITGASQFQSVCCVSVHGWVVGLVLAREAIQLARLQHIQPLAF